MKRRHRRQRRLIGSGVSFLAHLWGGGLYFHLCLENRSSLISGQTGARGCAGAWLELVETLETASSSGVEGRSEDIRKDFRPLLDGRLQLGSAGFIDGASSMFNRSDCITFCSRCTTESGRISSLWYHSASPPPLQGPAAAPLWRRHRSSR